MFRQLGKRAYATAANGGKQEGQGQGKTIMSFLERMDNLYATQSTKAGVKPNLEHTKSKSKTHKLADRSQRGDNKNNANRGPRKPRMAGQGQQQQQQQQRMGHRQGGGYQQRSGNNQRVSTPRATPRAQSDRSKMLADDSFDIISSGEKLDTFVTPSKYGRNVPINSSRPNDRSRRAHRPQMPAHIKQRNQKGASPNSKAKFNRQPSNRPAKSAARTEGTVSPEEAIKLLRQKVVRTGAQSGFISVEALSSSSLGSTFSTMTTAEARIYEAAKSAAASGEDISDVINHRIKGITSDVVITPKTHNLTLTALSNNLNAHPDLPHKVKDSLIDVASGLAHVNSLKQ